MAKDVKKSKWTFLLYPESAPEDWRDRLQATGLPFAVSPLHDKDVNPTGEPKKPHYHIILDYPGPTTYSVVQRLTESLNQPVPQPLEAVKGMYRYFTHMDNPEKYQYSSDGIYHGNGFDPADYSDLTSSQVQRIEREVLEICRQCNIVEYASLVDLLDESDDVDKLSVVMSHTIFFNSYLSSKRHRTEVGQNG